MNKFVFTKEGFTADSGKSFTNTISVSSAKGSINWHDKQNASLQEYRETHESGNYPDHVIRWFKILRAIISENCLSILDQGREAYILDIGCGISAQAPFYAPEAKLVHYVGLDPMNVNPNRSYPHIFSQLEELSTILTDTKFDFFVFSTSLDHFEDFSKLRDELRLFASDQAKCIFLSGLHDSNIIASWQAFLHMQDFTRMTYEFTLRNRLRFCNRLIKFTRLMQSQFQVLCNRQQKLDAGLPLDDLHFHYFQLQDYRETLSKHFGPIVDEILLLPENAVISIVKLT